MVNVLPCSRALRTSIAPPASVTIAYTSDRPSPVPRPISFVVKKGSKMRASVASSMPDTGGNGLERHAQGARSVNGLDRVAAQVHHHLVQLRDIADHDQRRLRGVRLET